MFTKVEESKMPQEGVDPRQKKNRPVRWIFFNASGAHERPAGTFLNSETEYIAGKERDPLETRGSGSTESRPTKLDFSKRERGL